MFDVGFDEMLVIAVIAIVVIGPKDLPRALRTAGGWVAKMRRVSGHFRSGIETMIREAELEEMERKWREQNEAIMQAHPAAPLDQAAADAAAATAITSVTAEAGAEAGAAVASAAASVPAAVTTKPAETDSPQLPLSPP